MSDYTHSCTMMSGTNPNIQWVLENTKIAIGKQNHTFYDRVARSVSVPRGEKGSPFFDDGYAEALWDYRNGDILLSSDEQTLWVRDVDVSGQNRLLATWHPIASLENEYHVARARANRQWNQQLRVECAKLPVRLRKGVKFVDRAYTRDIDGNLVTVQPGDDLFEHPYQLEYEMAFDARLAAKANMFLRDITRDEHSAKNLARMFATPLLEEYKHLSYILFGDGGNGKGIILSTIMQTHSQLSATIDTARLLGGRNGGGFVQEQENGKLVGKLWAWDEDADDINVNQLTALKKLSTGDTMVARNIQENAVSFAPQCTFIIATNASFTSTMTNASARRYVYVRMRDGRSPDEFRPLLAFRKIYGVVPFVMASCALWAAEGDEPYHDVSIADPNALSDAEQWLVDCIVNDGYAVSKDNPYREDAATHRNTLNKLGLRSVVKRVDGSSRRVLVVVDEHRFAPYRDVTVDQFENAETGIVEPPDSTIDAVPPTEFGFEADYVPAGADKVAVNWKKLAESDADTSTVPATPVHAVVPAPGYAVIDMDMSKDDGKDGWQAFVDGIGAYGTLAFPKTYLVRTPSGGVHAYYRLPDSLREKLKNSVHSNGIPVDIRTERKGYVIGAGSKANAGDYRLVDVPEGDVPTMSLDMCAWLDENGYVEKPKKGKTVEFRRRVFRPDTSNGNPDMSPVPEGQRNSYLHAWAYGRMANHPENKLSIHDDLVERGRKSGLDEAEIETMWGSVLRQLGE